jgi:trimeric autotransporter adhesin
MKKLFQQIIAVFFICFCTLQIKAQNIGIGTTTPHASAKLDISDTAKGILIPRLTLQQRNAIASPAKGLMIFVTTDSSFYFFDGNWKRVAVANEGWSITGNNSIGSANFIGTVNAQPLRFRVNNLSAGEINFVNDNISFGFQSFVANTTGFSTTAIGSKALFNNTTGSGNTALGKEALFQNTTGSANTAIGANSLNANTTGGSNIAVGNGTLFRNTTGADNTAVGLVALGQNINGNQNTAVGSSALNFNTSGSANTAVGERAIVNNTTGGSNTAVGQRTLSINTTGSGNTALGSLALRSNVNGNSNVAVGQLSLAANSSGSQNTVVGNNAMDLNTTGVNNTAVGFQAMRNNTTGILNTAIGGRAGVSTGNLSNTTAIGFDAIVNASNKIRLGNASVTVIEGQVPFTTPSDGRFKTNVKENVIGLNFIMQLRPVTYQFNTKQFDAFIQKEKKKDESFSAKIDYTESQSLLHSGFIAQEVEQAAKKTGFQFDGIIVPKNENETYSLSYAQFVVPLVKAVQEQQQQIDLLKKQNELLIKEMQFIKQTIKQ